MATTSRELENLSDEELVVYLMEHRRPNGGLELEVDDFDRLEPRAKARLADRLLAAQNRMPECHMPVDLEYLDQRIRQVAEDRASASSVDAQREIREQTISDDDKTELPDPNEEANAETDAHDKLVKDGCRPLYPIESLQQVLQNPDKHRDILRPFWDHPTDREQPITNNKIVFQRQWDRWRVFRRWQLEKRRLEDPSDAFEPYLDEVRAIYEKWGYVDGLARLKSDPASFGRPGSWWDKQVKKREWERKVWREPADRSFDEYVTTAKGLLARYGSTQAFRLEQDPGRQSALDTWMEYLCFECWWQDWYIAEVERLTPIHDQAWAELWDLGILNPDESAEFLRTNACGRRRDEEMETAGAAHLAAEIELERLSKLSDESITGRNATDQSLEQRKEAARKEYEVVRAKYDEVFRRTCLITDFIRGTFDYVDAKYNAANQVFLLKWAMEQVPSLLPASSKTKGRKRKSADEDEESRPMAKKRSPVNGTPTLNQDQTAAPATPPSKTSATDGPSRAATRPKRQARSSVRPPTPSSSLPPAAPVLRRSARINEQQIAAAAITATPPATRPSTKSKAPTRKRAATTPATRSSKKSEASPRRTAATTSPASLPTKKSRASTRKAATTTTPITAPGKKSNAPTGKRRATNTPAAQPPKEGKAPTRNRRRGRI